MESRFYEEIDNETLRCIICPRMCVIKAGQEGFCGTKKNVKGKIEDLTYGQISAIAVDPIEKKPLAHFYPGSLALSISSIGCSFTCPWCQNWHLSMAKLEDSNVKYMEPESVVDIANKKSCTSIAYTYNEPVINLNYVEDVSRIASIKGVKNVLVTNGYISIKALSRVVDVVDAVNVDWKSFNDGFYREFCKGDLQSVLDSTEYMKRHGVHVEVTYLIIPEINDNLQEMREMARYLVKNLGPDTPLHLSRFYPQHRFNHLPSTPLNTLLEARETALKEGVHYVFIGNVPGGDYDDTICPRCGVSVVERTGYIITGWNLDKDRYCEKCGEKIPLTGEREIHRRF
jgi:pyruvate formate lyase activating enzyme